MFSGRICGTLAADWGNVPSWVSAVVALLALGVASFAGLVAWKNYERLEQQVGELERDKRAEQANKVAVWLELVAGTVTFHFANASELPVTRFVAWVSEGSLVGGAERLDALHPGTKTIPLAFSPGLTIVETTAMAFLDNSGRAWMRWGTSELQEISHADLSYLGWVIPGGAYQEFDAAGWIDQLENPKELSDRFRDLMEAQSERMRSEGAP